MKLPRDKRTIVQQRTLINLDQHYQAFMSMGGDLRHAKEKEIKNVIDDIYFNIDLDQVSCKWYTKQIIPQ